MMQDDYGWVLDALVRWDGDFTARVAVLHFESSWMGWANDAGLSIWIEDDRSM
jgi:hypothetical protein